MKKEHWQANANYEIKNKCIEEHLNIKVTFEKCIFGKWTYTPCKVKYIKREIYTEMQCKVVYSAVQKYFNIF